MTLARDVSIWRFEAAALNTLATIENRSDTALALAHHEEALRLSRLSGDRYPETEAPLGLAAATYELGDFTTARQHAESAVRLATEAGYRMLEGRALCALARVELARGDLSRAVRHSGQAVESFRNTGHRPGLADALRMHGHVLDQTGRVAEACHCWQESLAIYDNIGMPEGANVRALLGIRAGHETGHS